MNKKKSLIDLLIHDLTGPLSIAFTSVNNLVNKQDRYGPLTERQKTTLDMALRNINKARTYLNEMIEVYHSEEGLFKKELFLVNDVLKDALIEAIELINPGIIENLSDDQIQNKFEQFLNARSIAVELTGKYSNLSFCHDKKKIQQILKNLITNALKYRREKILISISGDSDIVISVEDDGSGIPQEKQEDVFKRFSHQEDREQSDISGLGFGLSCVKTIVETMQGTITLSSKEEGGSCFTIRIPSL